MTKLRTDIAQLLERYETRIKEGKFVITIRERVKEIAKRFFRKKPEGGEKQPL